LHTLAVDDTRAGGGLPADPEPPRPVEGVVDASERTVVAPPGEVGVDGLPVGEVAGEVAPRARALVEVEDGVEDAAEADGAVAAPGALQGEEGLDEGPLLVGEVGGVPLHRRRGGWVPALTPHS